MVPLQSRAEDRFYQHEINQIIQTYNPKRNLPHLTLLSKTEVILDDALANILEWEGIRRIQDEIKNRL